MSRHSQWTAAAALFLMSAACSGRHSSSGFRLAPDGDPERGKAAFVSQGCNSCHQVSGADLPQAPDQSATPVVLGGEVETVVTDGYLVSSIIYPSYKINRAPKAQMMTNGQSRMPHYAENMTVRQLTDIVAFLQSHYTLRRYPTRYYY